MAVTTDIIRTYCFGADNDYVGKDNFGKEWKETINDAWQKGAILRSFPWLVFLMRRFPRPLANKLDPKVGMFLHWQDMVRDSVKPLLEGTTDAKGVETGGRTIFHTLRDSDLPSEEKSLQRLTDEGQIITAAGSETTAKTLATILYYLTTCPDCLNKLQAELMQAMPIHHELASWNRLSILPYLSAVIQEGLRLSYGLTTRLPRISHDPIQYHDWTIPAGVPVSETPYFVLSDPVIFPEPDSFKPERWLGGAGQKLEQYQVSFGKGNRQCIGMSLAYAELYLTAAAVFRRHEFELFETGPECVKMVHDYFVAMPEDPHKGVRVKVSAAGI